MLEELGIELWIGAPARIRKAAPRKHKTDRNDPQLLLQLLEENRFPRIWPRLNHAAKPRSWRSETIQPAITKEFRGQIKRAPKAAPFVMGPTKCLSA